MSLGGVWQDAALKALPPEKSVATEKKALPPEKSVATEKKALPPEKKRCHRYKGTPPLKKPALANTAARPQHTKPRVAIAPNSENRLKRVIA